MNRDKISFISAPDMSSGADQGILIVRTPYRDLKGAGMLHERNSMPKQLINP